MAGIRRLQRTVSGEARMDTRLKLADIRSEWDRIRPVIERLIQKGNGAFRAEDVYAAVVTGSAHLYTGETGFIVVQPDKDKITGEAALLIWIACASGTGNITRFQPAIDQLAIENGYHKLVMSSPRKGWERVEGWRKVTTLFERDLP
jgi:hypothetical protein